MKLATCRTLLMAVAAAALATSLSYQPAAASVLWVDTHHQSVNVPLDSPSMGIARAKVYLEQQKAERAVKALQKVVLRWPNSAEAHALLAKSYAILGESTQAATHSKLAQQHGGGGEHTSTLR